MKMEPQVVVITRSPVSRAASLLREAGYLVSKVSPELAGNHTEAEALVVDLRLFELIQWLDQQHDQHHDDRIVIIAPNTTVIKGLTARTVQAAAIEDDLTSAVDRIVADQRIAAHRAVKVLRLPATTRADEAPYSPLTSFFGAMAR
jgi:hypothetical protein